MRSVLWPGFGIQMTGFRFGLGASGTMLEDAHTLFGSAGLLYLEDRWIEDKTYDAVMARCGVRHGASPTKRADQPAQLAGGSAAPPQLDIYRNTSYYQDGAITQPPFTRMSLA